ncbi:hypothetical protein [Bacillus phage phiAGATE]|uniref:Uncharacterized protein n=1 Tax=Bacillus phage phiAGATE TaxID=1204533 RepID=L0LC61_9CAUD|nr:hypothetical protein G380_gp021 [Bacillus phage phiAGATE]AGB62671.1 hypothetical protein [Bacillus phage phiAGATE]
MGRMEKKLIEELTQDELKKVWENNPKLQEQVKEDFMDSEMHWVSERLDYLKPYLSDWSVGAHNPSYIDIGDYEGFVEGAERLSREMGLLQDEEDKKAINEMNSTRDAYELADEETDAEVLEELEDIFHRACDGVADNIAQLMEHALDCCYVDSNALDYFLDFYAPVRMDDDYYVEPKNEYKLFKTVTESF